MLKQTRLLLEWSVNESNLITINVHVKRVISLVAFSSDSSMAGLDNLQARLGSVQVNRSVQKSSAICFRRFYYSSIYFWKTQNELYVHITEQN